MKTFKIDDIKAKNTETIDIEGEQFEVDIGTRNIKEIVMKGHELQERGEEFANLSNELDEEDMIKNIEEFESVLKDATEFVLGEGSFAKIYPKTGESFMVMADVLYQVIDYLYEKQQKENEKKKAKYVKKKKKK